jgi:hypothetical protein
MSIPQSRRHSTPQLLAATADRSHDDAEANSRLTAATGVVLLVLLAIEGVTIVQVRRLIVLHVFIGIVLIPPVLLKVASTVWRAARYYLGSPEYRRRGAPRSMLRLLGPLVVILTVALLASGIALLYVPESLRASMLTLHRASFVLWFCVMTVHVLAHVFDTASLAPRDFVSRSSRQVRGASARQWALVTCIAAGLILGALVTPHAGTWLHPLSR